jgi:hypothetical protein
VGQESNPNQEDFGLTKTGASAPNNPNALEGTMNEYFPETGFRSIQFKSKVDGRWVEVRSSFGLFPTEAARKMEELQVRNPHMEYRLH